MEMIRREWWEHLAPKVMHDRLCEVNALFKKWCSSPYGSHWLSVANEEAGVLRVKPGQFIPVMHVIALGKFPLYIAPQRVIRVGHRMVGPADFRSGRSLEEGELAIRPEIRVEVVQDQALLSAAMRLDVSPRINDVKEPSTIFSAPASYLLTPTTSINKAYVLYQHIFGEGHSYPDDGFFYIGVTKRRWQKRWSEHRRAMKSGSPLLVHKKLREELEVGRVTYIHHKVMGITDDLEKLYATEEWIIARHWTDQRRLNMIPGGKSGLRYMRENGMLDGNAPFPDERDQLIETWVRKHPLKGLPAPWIAEKWKDDEWAAAQICSRDERLSVEQVKAIRRLSKKYSVDMIVEKIGARSKSQVQRVIDGETYTRIL